MGFLVSAPSRAIVGPDCVRETMQGILREAQLRGWTDETLEEASGVDQRAIKSYRVEGREPSLSRAYSIAVTLGSWAVQRLNAMIGYGASPLDEATLLIPGVLVSRSIDSFAVIARAAADGRFDHTEMPKCRQAADAIIETVLPLSSVGAAA